ncbi:MAG TPA: LPS assembly protein LptD [Candidatus Acidoferrum sp.]|nr:LPS assembly protein LptD [Candidatus Acidoferrum sp.]
MLGYSTVFIGSMLRVNRHLYARNFSALRLFFLTALFSSFSSSPALGVPPQQIRLPSGKGGIAELSSSGPQRRQGDLYIADGDVDIRYGDLRLRADHVEYNNKTSESVARGHVQFDYENQHLEGDEAHYNVSTGRGLFRNVRGTVKIERRPNPTVLVSENPLYFEAREVERLPGYVYLVREAWITVCDPEHPKWQFYASHARIRVDKTVALVNANFRLFRVPLIWLPYATAPAGRKVRQSGFLIPEPGNSSRKGFILGDAYYWAPAPWFDATVGAQYLSSRGSEERGEFRARPFENTSIKYTYFGVIDRGLLDAADVRHPQGGHQQQFEMKSLLPDNWRFVADVNQLSSLTFRLAFADTFGDAINSEIRSAVFLTNNFKGFSLNFAALSDRSFLTISPATSVVLRNIPEARFGSVEQAPWKNLPVYFGFDSFVGAVHREDTSIDTPAAVQRAEFAPRVTLPIHFGPWLGVTTSAAFRTTRYGASLDPGGLLSEQPITRNTGEFTLELRPPTLERFFGRPSPGKTKSRKRYKHAIEPGITYRYVTGVNNFPNFIRFDADSTLTDTNEVEYGVTQRLYRKDGDAAPQEVVSWRLVQKHFFDPTFGGAVVNGQRNVFETLNSFTPFAFAFGPRNSSPLISDFKITPGGLYDTEQILEYDPQLSKITVIGTLLKVKPYKEFFATIAHFRLQADPILQPLSNQIRALVGYGGETRRGFNFTTGISYDITNSALQNQVVQVSYNGGCCGIALAYRRVALGTVRTDNQFSAALIIANIGTFGNLRRQEKIF